MGSSLICGFMQANELIKWVSESESALKSIPRNFGVLIDMRNLSPLPLDAQQYMEKGQKMYKDKGMLRSLLF